MSKTTRVVIEFDEAETADLEREAIAQGCSLAELVRRRALTIDEDVLTEMLAWLKDSNARADAAVARTLAHGARLDAERPAREAAIIAAVREEFSEEDMAAFAAWLFPEPRELEVSDPGHVTKS